MHKPFTKRFHIHFQDHVYRSITIPITYIPKIEILPGRIFVSLLKGNMRTKDEMELNHFPYFGDKDTEDVVSDLFDIKCDKKQCDADTEYYKKVMDFVLIKLRKYIDDTLLQKDEMSAFLAIQLEVEESVRVDCCFIDCKGTN